MRQTSFIRPDARAGPPQKEDAVSEYEAGKDVARLQADVAELRRRLDEVRKGAEEATNQAEEEMMTMLTELGIIRADDEGEFALGDAFKKAEE